MSTIAARATRNTNNTITTNDGTTIYYKGWGKGPIITFSHGWPLSADASDGQLQFFADNDRVNRDLLEFIKG